MFLKKETNKKLFKLSSMFVFQIGGLIFDFLIFAPKLFLKLFRSFAKFATITLVVWAFLFVLFKTFFKFKVDLFKLLLLAIFLICSHTFLTINNKSSINEPFADSKDVECDTIDNQIKIILQKTDQETREMEKFLQVDLPNKREMVKD